MIIQVNMVTVNNNSPIQDYIHLDAHAQLTYDNVPYLFDYKPSDFYTN